MVSKWRRKFFLQRAQSESAACGEVADGERVSVIEGGPFAEFGDFAATDHRGGRPGRGEHLAKQSRQAAEKILPCGMG